MFLWRNLDPGTVAAVIGYLRQRAASRRSPEPDGTAAFGREGAPTSRGPVLASVADKNEAGGARGEPFTPPVSPGRAGGSGGS